jgi:uncharacterized protein YeaO (DUF488 family)
MKKPAKATTRKPQTRSRRNQPPAIAIKRAYDKAVAADGVRILIDRLWPRGLSKATLKFDAWPRELAPSTELRRWYGHDPERFAEFRRRYKAELDARSDEVAGLRAMIRGRAATLITATHDLELSHASILRDALK